MTTNTSRDPGADPRLRWPAPLRNRDPILAVLRRVLPERGRVLEVASGSGQHVVHFARALPQLQWQPTDVDPDALASVAGWIAHEGLDNVAPPLHLDVLADPWPLTRADAIFCSNLVHIAPWACCEALLRGAGQLLAPGGVLALYGAFRRGGRHTAPSNQAFDRSLRASDPSWGVRDLDAVTAAAAPHGLLFDRAYELPANNLTVVFRRS